MRVTRSLGKNGLSVLELVIALGILVLIMGGAISLDINYNMIFRLGVAYLDMQNNARQTLDWLTNDARWATQIVSAFGGYATSASSVVLQVPSVNAAGLVIDDTYDYIIFRLNGTNVQRIVVVNVASSRDATTKTLASGCTSLVFRDSSGGALLSALSAAQLAGLSSFNASTTLTRTVLMQNGARNITETISSTVRFRNK